MHGRRVPAGKLNARPVYDPVHSSRAHVWPTRSLPKL